MIRILFFNLFSYVMSQGINNHNCNVDEGYTWCETYNKCVNENFEPCLPITRSCIECLTRNFGINKGCGPKCSISLIENIGHEGFLGTDENGCIEAPSIIWCETLNACISDENICPMKDRNDCDDIITCPMFCENGYKTNSFGCQICKCDIVNSYIEDVCPLQEQNCEGNTYVCPIVREITHCSTGGIPGYTTYELSLQVINEDVYNIYALFGDNTLSFQGGTSMFIPSAYQEDNIFNSNFGGIPEEIISINPNLRYDSWLTIGLINGDPEHRISSVGIDFSEWNSENDLLISNGAIFLLDPMEQMNINKGNEYVIAQLTIRNDLQKHALINVQGKTKDGFSWAERYIIFNLIRSTESHVGH
tara:strand:- start:2474 stop:3559 length:1086 start_codon:yes stop_codon:yes gene_type:complete